MGKTVAQNRFAKDGVMPIAIVGMGFRGPGDASDPESFYKLIAEAREAWSPIPERRWVADAFYHPDPMRNGASNVRGGHFFKQDLSSFDAPFFGMREEEAACLDPQQRILLECCYEALEDSGTPMERAVGSNTAVFVGTFGADFAELLYRDAETMPTYQATNAGNSRAIISNRLSYYFDFKGPSATVDTACSASMVAFHLACQALRSGDADQAVVGGSSVILNSDLYISMSAMGFLSPEGRCYSFDERAQGYGRGEGVGCVLVKPLDKALRDGDAIRAVVRNTASNQDGKTPGITFPSGAAQEALMRGVYAKAGLDPADTTYVEAHGTGTQAGDPVEAGAIAAVFGPGRSANRPLKIGSVKSNVGHLEGASGITGVIKAVMMLENGVILPSRNFRKANKRIPLDEWKLQVATQLEPWQPDGPRRLSINSFGYGGSNAHAILEDASTYLAPRGLLQKLPRKPFAAVPNSSDSRNGAVNGTKLAPSANGEVSNGICKVNGHSNGATGVGCRRVFVCSSFDEVSGKEQARRLARYLGSRPVDDAHLADLAHTLGARRVRFPWKVALVAASAEELVAQLEEAKPSRALSKPPAVGFIFTGQGAQWAGMSGGLADAFPAYRASLERARDRFRELGAAWDLMDELSRDADQSRVNEAEFSQPICTAVQCALVDLLASWGIAPAAATGHSSGEIAAAYCVGAMSLEATMTAAYYRGLVAGRLAGSGKLKVKGAMMAVALGKPEVQPLLDRLEKGRVSVACENSPASVTVSGDAVAVDELHALLKAERPTVFARKLLVDVAYHSHHMRVIGDEYLACIPKIDPPSRSSVQFYSSVTGELAHPTELGPAYWVTNLLSEVKFATALSNMCHGAAIDTLVEVGPHSALAGPAKQTIGADTKLRDAAIAYNSTLVRNKDAIETVTDLAAKLAARGAAVELAEVNRDPAPRVLAGLPPYPWNHSRSFWAEGRISKAYRERRLPRSDILGAEAGESSPLEPRWRNVVRLSEQPWLHDHVVQSSIVYPAGGYVAMAIEAAKERALAGDTPFEGFRLREVVISQALVVPEDRGEVETAVTLRPHAEGTRSLSDVWQDFSIFSVSRAGRWVEHCRGLISLVKPPAAANDVNGAALDHGRARGLSSRAAAIEAACTQPVDVARFYEDLGAVGLRYGPTFASVAGARAGPNACAARLAVPDPAAVMPHRFHHPFVVHPALVDGMLHPLFAAAAAGAGRLAEPFVPVFIREVFVSAAIPAEPGAALDVYAATEALGTRQLRASILAHGASREGEGAGAVSRLPLASIDGVTCTGLGAPDASEVTETAAKGKTAWSPVWGLDPDFLRGRESLEAACPHTDPVRRAAWYVGLLGFKNPELAVLELDQAGAPAATEAVLASLDVEQQPRFARFDVACQTADHVEATRERLGPELSERVGIRVLDLAGDVEAQGLEPASYDVVVGTAASAGTGPALLGNLNKLLRPGGKLVLLEPMGGRSSSSEEEWARLLADAGFSDEFSPLPASSAESGSQGSMTIATAAPSRPVSDLEVVVVVDERTERVVDVSVLKNRLATTTASVSVSTPQGADVVGKLCIVLAELASPFMHAPSEAQFAFSKDAFLRSGGVLWVTRGAASTDPLASTVLGVARTARSENGTTTIATLDLDAEAPLDPVAAAAVVFDTFDQRIGRETGSTQAVDLELREEGGRLWIPRLLEQQAVNELVSETTLGPKLEDQPLVQEGRQLRIDVGTPGLLDSIRWVDDDSAADSLPPDRLEVQVKAAGVNFRDVMMALGQIAVETLGGECSGVVTGVGKDVAGFAVGDRVAFLHLGSYATAVRPKATIVRHIAPDMSFETAAALPVIFVTAYYSLFELARLRAGESVLIHAAAGGVGQAALELCRMAQAEVFVTVGSKAKKRMVMDRFGVPEDHIFFSRDGSFAQAVADATNGHGVDVILNSVAGEAHRLTWNCVAPFGRFVELGKRDIFVNTRLEMERFAKNVTFSTFDLVDMIRCRPDTCGHVWAKVLDLFQRRLIRPPEPIKTYPMSDTVKALKMMQSGKHMGKLVSVVVPRDSVKAVSLTITKPLFRKDASYLIVGGLGGLGRAISSWMIRRGARSLIFLTRRGLAAEGTRAAVDELEKQGGRIDVVACDVANPNQVEKLLLAQADTRPPIRGVIHSAMVLKDALFEKMTLADYQLGLRAKVQGTLNLAAKLPAAGRELEFFVLLSSLNGVIGNASQANYAAANAFLDAFAAHRARRHGLPAAALDLGVIAGVGHVASNADLARGMQRQGFAPTAEPELLAMVQHAVTARPNDRPAASQQQQQQQERHQIVSGLGTWNPASSLANLARPLFAHFRRQTAAAGAHGGGDGANVDVLAQVKALPPGEAAGRVCAELAAKVALLCMIPPEDVAPAKTLASYGMDSLVAVEMRNWIFRTFACTVPILELLADSSLVALSARIAEKVAQG